MYVLCFKYTGHRSLITEFGINGDGIDKVTRSLHSSRIYVHCTPRSDEVTNATAEWFFANGTRVGARPGSTLREQQYTNGTTVLVIGFSSTLSYCDGGFYTCVVNSTSGRSEKRTFHLRVGSKSQVYSATYAHHSHIYT